MSHVEAAALAAVVTLACTSWAFLCLPDAAAAQADASDAQVEFTLHRAEEADPDAGPPGAAPYEMAGRAEERPPLVAMDDVAGWVVEGRNAEGWLTRSREQRLTRDSCAKLVYLGKGTNPTLLVRPKEPIPIPDPWDSVNFWTYGNNWGWAPDPKTPPLSVAVVVRDAAGWEFEIPLGRMDYTYWFLMNGRLHAGSPPLTPPTLGGEGRAIRRPAHFVGFRFRNAGNRERRAIHLGPLTFFREELKPLHFAPWPSKLPFPTRPETILPINKATGFRNETRREGKAALFRYRGRDCDLEYRYTPSDGTLGDVEVHCRGKVMRPFVGGGIALATARGRLEPDDPSVRRTLKGQRLAGGVLSVTWRLEYPEGATDVEYRFRIRQKSLVVEISASEPVVERVALGRAEGTGRAKLVAVPYLTYGGNDPRVLCAHELFLFSQFDWYVSDASELFGGASLGPDWAVYNGGARYVPKTDGTRNRVRERLFLTVSPDFQEVLPTIPNPPSPWRERQGERLWRTKHGDNHAAEIEEATRLRQLGCDKVTIRYHEESWRDTGESYTFRVDVAPGRGGDAGLKRFVEAIQALGWHVGLYTNYTDYAPVNAYWNEDWVSRLPNGDWQRAWMRCYAPKPMRAVEMEARLAPQIRRKFGTTHTYCDVHTAVTPFSRVDYDARVPGAGTFRRTFECFGRLLYNGKASHQGPVFSEGNNHWWYAGLADGNYAQMQLPSNAPERLLVDFDLLKMHPLCMDAGIGFRGGPPVSFDQAMAFTLAYGHIGNFTSVRHYYLLQQTQKRYAMVPVRTIEYEAGGELVDTSRAILTDAYRSGRVRVVYENDTQIHVNGSPEPWSVAGPGHRFELPEWGYLVWRPGDDLLTFSAKVPVGGPYASHGPTQRVDCSLGTGQCYADSRGGFVFLGGLAVEGAAALKKDGDDWWVIPTGPCADFAFSPAIAGWGEKEDIEVMGTAPDGTPIGLAEARWSRGLLHIPRGEGAPPRYRVRLKAAPRPTALACESTLAPIGEVVRVALPLGVRADACAAVWEVGGKQSAGETQVDGGALACRVPAAARAGEHLWLRVQAPERAFWIDFIAVEPLRVALETALPALLAKGEPLRVHADIANTTGSEAAVSLQTSTSGEALCRPENADLVLPARRTTSHDLALSLPGAGKYTLRVAVRHGEATAAAEERLVAQWIDPVLLDLLDPQVPRVSGHCPRGGTEVAGFSAIEEGSFAPTRAVAGGVQRECLFSHPPYAPGKVGYSFTAYDVDLPAGKAASLRFHLGMRDGLHATDGVTFKVVILDEEGRETEVFARHYAETRWTEASADLSAFAGRKVRLKLVADCGPKNDTTADHALWGEPKVVLHDEDARRLWIRRAE